MDILFENRYIVDLHMLRSFARGASFSQKFFFRFSIVGMAVCAMALLYCLVFFPGSWDLTVSPAISFLLCLALFFFPSLTARIVYRNTQKLHGGIIPETVVQFSNDEISMAEGTLSVRFQYRQITKIRETRNLYVLMLGKDSGIILEKNSFTIGNFEAFRSFILENAPAKKSSPSIQKTGIKSAAFLWTAALFLKPNSMWLAISFHMKKRLHSRFFFSSTKASSPCRWVSILRR